MIGSKHQCLLPRDILPYLAQLSTFGLQCTQSLYWNWPSNCYIWTRQAWVVLAAHVFKIIFWNLLNILHLNFAYNLSFQLFWLERYKWVLLRRNVSVGVDAITAGRYLKYFQTLSCSGCLLLSLSVIGFKIGENEPKKNNHNLRTITPIWSGDNFSAILILFWFCVAQKSIKIYMKTAKNSQNKKKTVMIILITLRELIM